MLGNSILKPTKTEEYNKNEFRRFVVAINHIEKGEIFTNYNTGLRRVAEGKGIGASSYETVIGKKSTKNYLRGEPIKL